MGCAGGYGAGSGTDGIRWRTGADALPIIQDGRHLVSDLHEFKSIVRGCGPGCLVAVA